MGYNITRSIVHTYVDILEVIRVGVEANEPVSFGCSPDDLAREQYRLREAMKSAAAFPELYNGKYAKLGEHVVVTTSPARNEIIVKPKVRLTKRLAPPDERAAVASLSDVAGTLHVLEFYPSPRFDERFFISAVERKGWTVHTKGKVVEDDKVSYPIERTSKTGTDRRGGFSSLLSEDPEDRE